MKTRSLIDSHQHSFWHGRDDIGLVEDMDAGGIAQCWLLTWEIAPWEDSPAHHGTLNPANLRGDGTHAGVTFSDQLAARNRFPDRFILGFCPHPLMGDAPGRLEAAAKMHGIRVCGEWKFRILLDDPRCIELFQKAGELGLPTVIHMDVPWLQGPDGKRIKRSRWHGGTIENLERAIRACPETNFIGHAPGFWREISSDAEVCSDAYPNGPVKSPGRLHHLFDACPNLYADLSAGSGLGALRRDANHARQFLIQYADRLLFGRDYYGNELQEFLETLKLPEETWRKIGRENALRLLGENSL